MQPITALYVQVWKEDPKWKVDGTLIGMSEEFYGSQSAHALLLTRMYQYDCAMTSGVEEKHQDEGRQYTKAMHGTATAVVTSCS